MKKFYIVLLLATCIFSTACSEYSKANCCTSRTSVILKDSCALDISIEFGFKTKKEMRDFKYKEQEILFALRLSMKQHESSVLKNRGKNNVRNAIKVICKRRLKNESVRIKITEYNFTNA